MFQGMMVASGGGGGAVELEFFYKSLASKEVFSINTSKKARAIYFDLYISGYGRIHYYVHADTPNYVYQGVETANAIEEGLSATFTDSTITFNRYFTSYATTAIGVIIY